MKNSLVSSGLTLTLRNRTYYMNYAHILGWIAFLLLAVGFALLLKRSIRG
jgi:hypothetical protein